MLQRMQAIYMSSNSILSLGMSIANDMIYYIILVKALNQKYVHVISDVLNGKDRRTLATLHLHH